MADPRSFWTYAFIVIVIALMAFGLVMVYSASFADSIDSGIAPIRAMRMQFIATILGIVVAVIIWRMLPLRWLSGDLAYLIWLACFALVVLTALFGTEAFGAKRWFVIGSLEFQPSELMKLAVVILAAKVFADYHRGEMPLLQAVIIFLLGVGLPLGVILIGQSDLGTTMICAVGIISVMLLGGFSKVATGVITLLGVAAGVLAIAGTPYRRARLAVWLDPFSDPLGDGYQVIHSYYALAEGGLFGVGLGQSHEKFQYLPFAQNDFIFAIIGEELGLVGAIFVVLLFFGLLLSGLAIAFRCNDEFGKMVAGAVVIMVVFEAFLNIACVIGLFPVTGKPLPFISQGGTSLLVVIASMGLVLAASKDYDGDDLYVKRRGNLRLLRGSR